MSRTAVYRFRAPDGWLLYIGMTVDPEVRFAYHRENACWWNLADESLTSVDWYDSRAEAATAELEAIRTENPEWNIIAKPGRQRDDRSAIAERRETLIKAAGEAMARAREKGEQAWEAMQLARAGGVPDDVLCRESEISRNVLSRKLGRRPAPVR